MNKIDPMEHTGLVYSVLNSNSWLYGPRSPWTEDDAFQEGMIVLIEALEIYDSNQGTIATYCMDRIRWGLHREFKQQCNLIRKPDGLQDKYNHYLKEIRRYQDLHNKKPSIKYLCTTLGMSKESLNTMIKAFVPVMSLDAPAGSQDDDFTLSDIIEDERDNFEAVDLQLQSQQLRADLERMMDEKLTAPDQNLIKDYYAWNGGKQPTLKELADKNNLSDQQVKARINNSLRKFLKFKPELTRNYPELIMKQIYTQTRYALPDLKRMRIDMIGRYLVIGDLIQIDHHFGTVVNIDFDTKQFKFSSNGRTYDIPFSKIYDFDMKGGQITGMFTGTGML